ncbi:hypothetical protein GRI62_06600 [Erythrobacter arachoides]|uniref:Uncharacterized protein n=2 Tax=Aurantiacibacter arachoides TaxID=1850444 RepID=A0A845A2A0_9SPHN|nr:hypothetical protein [Aurantiacibacter arachoides]GGD50616.1 hypothetical protein GCM10011411_08080 [Aurantiacibacter arachoides]
MAKMLRAFHEDRAMRDAAKSLVTNDWRNITGSYAQRGLGERLKDRLSEGASDLADDTSEFAQENPGVIETGFALTLAAAVGWLFREEIAESLQELWDRDWF